MMFWIRNMIVGCVVVVFLAVAKDAVAEAVNGPGSARIFGEHKPRLRGGRPAAIALFAHQRRGSPEFGETVGLEIHDSSGQFVKAWRAKPFGLQGEKAALVVLSFEPEHTETFTIKAFSKAASGKANYSLDRGNYGNKAILSWD